MINAFIFDTLIFEPAKLARIFHTRMEFRDKMAK